jgi:hypothetical protein
MDTTTLVNPFRVWAELTGGLRDRFVTELGESPSPHASEILGKLAALVTRCEHLGVSLQNLQERDPEGFDAFMRAQESA